MIIGAEIVPLDFPPIVLWAPDRKAYGRLSRLITAGRRRAVKGECELTFADVAEYATGLLAGLVTYPQLPDLQPLDPQSLASQSHDSDSPTSSGPASPDPTQIAQRPLFTAPVSRCRVTRWVSSASCLVTAVTC